MKNLLTDSDHLAHVVRCLNSTFYSTQATDSTVAHAASPSACILTCHVVNPDEEDSPLFPFNPELFIFANEKDEHEITVEIHNLDRGEPVLRVTDVIDFPDSSARLAELACQTYSLFLARYPQPSIHEKI
jgi:hypothetical protein